MQIYCLIGKKEKNRTLFFNKVFLFFTNSLTKKREAETTRVVSALPEIFQK